ncbi:MAG: tRNA pseudouridine(55) synthase TruB [Acidimicrobiia bacterium]
MARRKPATVHGLAVVDKPAGMTSHDVVAVARKRLGERRIGHSGTLDPDATGVLLLGVGEVTRLLRFLTALGKRYTAEIVLGTSTSTLDASGEVTGSFDMSSVTPKQVVAAAARLTGAIEQIPPMVSAVQIDGVRLHELARQGIEVERAPRPVTVHSFDVVPTGGPGIYQCEVHCSSGTYVRTLADDLGRLLGGGAHLRALRRTAIGSFGVAEAVGLDDLDHDSLLTPLVAMRDLPRLIVTDEQERMIANGRRLAVPDALAAESPISADTSSIALATADDRLLAVYERSGGFLVPVVVLPPR